MRAQARDLGLFRSDFAYILKFGTRHNIDMMRVPGSDRNSPLRWSGGRSATHSEKTLLRSVRRRRGARAIDGG